MPAIQASASTPALLSRRSTVLAPPSLSTVTHLSSSPPPSTPSQTTCTIPSSRSTAHQRRRDLNHSLLQPTAASPVSTRENISSSYTVNASTSLSGAARGGGNQGEGVAVTLHETFRGEGEMRGDVLVRVEGVEFFVHRDVLMFASPFFRGALGGGWRENRLSSVLVQDSDSVGKAEEATAEDGVQVQTKRVNAKVEATDNSSDAKEYASAKASEAEESEQQQVLVEECSDEEGDKAEDVAESGADVERLGGEKEEEARRRSLLRASYHTALCSQDHEMLSQAAVFSDTTEHLPNHDVGDEARSWNGAEDEDEEGFEDEVEQPSLASKLQQRPRRNSPSGSGAGLRQVRSKSKHLATRLTLRKLESANRKQSIPARSTSKPSISVHPSHSSPIAAQERFESLATPPISRRASQDAPTSSSTTPSDPTQSAANSVLPSRYKGITSVIDLAEESASTFHDFLFHTYPHLDLSVTWFNCGPLLRFSDKFQVPFLRRSCLTFLRAALAGRPIEAMRLAELHGFDDLYKEASRHVLDNFSSWDPADLDRLSGSTLLKLERKRTWFLERLLKLGLANPARDYECHASCPDPKGCAKLLGERWGIVYAGAVRYTPPQPSVVYRQLREAGWEGTGWGLSACQGAARVWVQGLFDRMFELGALHGSGRMFLSVKLDASGLGGAVGRGGMGRD